MLVEEIQMLIQAQFPKDEVSVKSDDNTHFEALIISDEFKNKKRIERQRMIYSLLGDDISSGRVHALSLKTYTKEEWGEKCSS